MGVVVRLHGWASWSEAEDSVKARVFGELVKRAAPLVEHYHSDFYRDAQWIIGASEDMLAEFYFSADDCGTWLSCEPDLGLARKHGWVVHVWGADKHGDGRLEWFASFEARPQR
jgi:hypothetical protein